MDYADNAIRYKIQTGVIEDINSYWARIRPNRQTVRLSPSSLGEECAAQTFFRFRWAAEPGPVDGRMARYNSRGEDNEADIIDWLRNTGWTIYDQAPNGEQISISDFGGHFYGKLDSVGSHPEYTNGHNILIEYKYVNTKRFVSLVGKPLSEIDPKYYGQICLYMDYLNLPACMFFPGNRNDEDIRPIIIPADPIQANLLKAKAKTILETKVRPARIAETPAFFKCKFCEYVDQCHNAAPLAKSCRSCVSCVPIDGGKFHCTKWGADIPSKEAIKSGCDEWVSV